MTNKMKKKISMIKKYKNLLKTVVFLMKTFIFKLVTYGLLQNVYYKKKILTLTML